MLSGITLAAKSIKPSITIVAAEPSGSNNAADVAASKACGRLIQDMPQPLTIADGLEGGALAAGRHLSTQSIAVAPQFHVCGRHQTCNCVIPV